MSRWPLVTFRIPPEMLTEIERAAKREEMQKSELIRAALRYYLYYRDLPQGGPKYKKIEVF